jgi:hypothetical protein
MRKHFHDFSGVEWVNVATDFDNHYFLGAKSYTYSLGQDVGRALVFPIWARIFVSNSPVFGEVAWNSDNGAEQSFIRGIERAFDSQSLMNRLSRDVSSALEGVFLLQFIEEQRGRPRGSGTWESRDHFALVVGEAVRAIRKQNRRATLRRVAMHLHMHAGFGSGSESQLSTWCTDFGWKSWADFLSSLGPELQT